MYSGEDKLKASRRALVPRICTALSEGVQVAMESCGELGGTSSAKGFASHSSGT